MLCGNCCVDGSRIAHINNTILSPYSIRSNTSAFMRINLNLHALQPYTNNKMLDCFPLSKRQKCLLQTIFLHEDSFAHTHTDKHPTKIQQNCLKAYNEYLWLGIWLLKFIYNVLFVQSQITHLEPIHMIKLGKPQLSYYAYGQ